MSISQYTEIETSTFEEYGTELFDLEECPLKMAEVEQLKSSALEIPREHVGVGDTGEECELYVGRIMVDVTKPIIVNQEQAKKILPIVTSEKMTQWVTAKTKHRGKLYVRRCAVNYMPKGSLVGSHDDGQANPDYLYFVVLHLNTDFVGGDFYSTHQKTKSIINFPNCHKLLLSRCNLTHGVKKVEDGLRITLVWFYADESAPEINRRNYEDNPLPTDSAAAKGFNGLIKPYFSS